MADDITDAPDFPPYVEPYESDQPCGHLPAHLERIAQRDYCAVNEGYWVLRDAATMLRTLLRAHSLKVATRDVSSYEHGSIEDMKDRDD